MPQASQMSSLLRGRSDAIVVIFVLVIDYTMATSTTMGNERSNEKRLLGRELSVSLLHHPEGPNFQRLLTKLKSIIPEHFSSGPETMPKDGMFMKNLLTTVRSVMAEEVGVKSDSERRQRAKEIVDWADKGLRDIRQVGHVDKLHVGRLMELFNNFFDNNNKESMKESMEWEAAAPFCAPGADCFLDVRHDLIVLEIKAMAKVVSDYIRHRMGVEAERNNRENNDPKENSSAMKPCGVCDAVTAYHTDAIFTHMMGLVSQLHRASLRNWHHILLILGNLADNGVTEEPINNDHPHTTADIVDMECYVVIEPDENHTRGITNECGRTLQSQYCKSPITWPDKQCQPKEGESNMREVGGQYAFSVALAGRWHVSVHLTLEEKKENNLDEDHIIGSVDRVNHDDQDKLIELILINQHVRFHDGKKVHVEVSGEADFKENDAILLRMAPTKFRMRVVFKAHLIDKSKHESNSDSHNHLHQLNKMTTYMYDKDERGDNAESKDEGHKDDDDDEEEEEDDSEDATEEEEESLTLEDGKDSNKGTLHNEEDFLQASSTEDGNEQIEFVANTSTKSILNKVNERSEESKLPSLGNMLDIDESDENYE